MDCEQDDNTNILRLLGDDESRSAVNSLILDYYKKFGRKRDLEQYFSLSTAQSDIRDPSSIFWARMKAENESSDSGERSDKKSDSSQELCRISIRFPAHPCISQDEDSNTKTESTSPPIIIEELPQDSKQHSEDETTKSEDDAMKSDDNSQKSYDVHLDTSLNKLHSPSSSITSQRKLEWDSLADVGYANESDRKTSASSLSTLERLALKQQYSNNDTQQSNLGVPTAHSTPLDENEAKLKGKKGAGKKSTKIYKKDIDVVEVNVPHSSNMNPGQSINVNLTKHISFNVEKNGKVSVDNILKDVRVSPEKVPMEIVAPAICQKTDREMQTSLTKTSHISSNIPDNVAQQKIPILISLNTLRSRVRRRKIRMAKRKLKSKKRADKENIPVQEKSGEQLSEAESFEYMPGHIYNQNQMTANNRPADTVPSNSADNKSSLESSGILTSDSSKGSKHSFTKDLEKSIELLKSALKQHGNDSALRKQLIQQVCHRLLSSRYRDDDSTTDFLSGLSFSSKKLGLGERNNTTSSTSDANNSVEKSNRPKKSILRNDKFNPGPIASTSQSVPNLPVASKSENLVSSNLAKNLSTSNTESDISSKEKTSSDNGHKVSSEELYKKYLQALKREEAYKKHLKDKEMFLKQKLVCSDSPIKVPLKAELKSNNRFKDLINDLTRNNYDDGSGDASKLEGGPSPRRDFNQFLPNRMQRSHSVFTLSSGISDGQNKKPNLKKKQCDMKDLSKPGTSKDGHYCCCPNHGNVKFTDSSVQVNIKKTRFNETCSTKHLLQEKLEPPKRSAKIISDDVTGNFKYVCLCSKNVIEEAPDDFLIYKCSRLNNKGIQLEESPSKSSNEVYVQCDNATCTKRKLGYFLPAGQSLNNKSSQTNMLIKMLEEQPINSLICGSDQHIQLKGSIDNITTRKSTITINEATRWIQTEISINPNILEPTLSDINIVSDTNCAKLVSENCREITKSSVTDLLSNLAVASSSAFSDSYTGTSKDIGNNIKNFEDIEKNRKVNNLNQEPNIEHAENFTIPIHSTNMTLMVSIGSDPLALSNRNAKEMVTECIGTEKVNAIEQATSLREECSKGVQFDKNLDDTKIIDHNSNKIGEIYAKGNNIGDLVKKTHMVNTCQSEENRFGTYPQTSAVNERKPLRRANTDTDKIQCAVNTGHGGTEETSLKSTTEILSDVQGEPSIKRFQTQQISTQTNNHLKGDDKCQCGCGGEINFCKNSCKEMKLLSKIENSEIKLCRQPIIDIETDTGLSQDGQCRTYSLDKEIYTQTDVLLSEYEKCPCGCGGTKDKCKKSCIECQSSPRQKNDVENKRHKRQIDTQTGPELTKNDQCAKPSVDKEIYMLTDITRYNKCTCGCGNIIDKCKSKCKERQLSPRNNVTDNNVNPCIPLDKHIGTENDNHKNIDAHGNYPLIKEIGIQSNDIITKHEKCSCGCGGEKNKCKKSCRDNKEKCGIQLNKQIDAQTYMTPNTKDNYQKGDKELKLTAREPLVPELRTQNQVLSWTPYASNYDTDKCSCGCGGMRNTCLKSCKEAKQMPREYRTQTDKKEVGTQNDVVESSLSFKYRQEDEANPNTSCNVNVRDTVLREDRSQIDKKESGTQKNHDESLQRFTCLEEENKKSQLRNSCNVQNTVLREDRTKSDKREFGTQKNSNESPQRFKRYQQEAKPIHNNSQNDNIASTEYIVQPVEIIEDGKEKSVVRSSDRTQKSSSDTEPADSAGSDPILNLIQNITKKYTKNEVEKSKRKKCFKEIMTVLNYLLDTDELPDGKEGLQNRCESTTTADETDTSVKKISHKSSSEKVARKFVDKGIQPPNKLKSSPCGTESSEVLTSTEPPGTSTDSATCKVLNKIKKECDKYHQKRCKVHSAKCCECTSSTSVNCDQCRRVHHCQCRSHKCKNHKKSTEKMQKTSVAYNLILQTSESMMSEGPSSGEQARTLKNIIVKVPKKKPHSCIPFRELAAKFEKQMASGTSKDARCSRSKSLPNDSEISSMEEIMRRSHGATVREYLEKNRPDFIEKCAQRQTCMRYNSEFRCNDPRVPSNLKMVIVHTPNCTGNCNAYCGGIPNTPMPYMNPQCIEPRVVNIETGVPRIGNGSEMVPYKFNRNQFILWFGANERAVKRELLSLHLARLPDVTDLDSTELNELADELGRYLRSRKPAPKLISEREMKKHSENIYKSLPEVVQKKEKKRKESIKKTNLLMADIFKRNLQKKTLRGSVNLSNYSTVIKI